jgi:hypothetical protein
MRNAVYDRFSISTGRERTELPGGKGVLMNTSTLACMCKPKIVTSRSISGTLLVSTDEMDESRIDLTEG